MSPPNSYAELLRDLADEDWNDDPTDVVARLRTLASLLDRLPDQVRCLRAFVDKYTAKDEYDALEASILALLAGTGDAPGAL